jgi:uncharacterized membrane protein
MPRESHQKHHRREVSRVEGFSDAVFAFAITLLVVSLEVPKTFDELMTVIRAFPIFAVGFALVFQVWWRHYRFFRNYDLEDGTVITLTGILLFVVLFYVYPLKFLWSTFFTEISLVNGPRTVMTSSDVAALFEIYGLGVAAVFGILALLYRHAYRHRDALDLTAVEIVDTRVDIYRNLAMAGIALASATTAFVLLRVAPGLVGIAGFMYALIGIAEWWLGDYGGKLRKRAA